MGRSSEKVPASMEAARLNHYDGKRESLCLEQVPVPTPGPGQVLVRMAASPINPSDVMFTRGLYGLTKPVPAIPGFEGAGTVVAAGFGFYGRWLVGKRVACGALPQGGGTWAQYLATAARMCMHLPDRVSDEQGAMALANPATAFALFFEARHRGHSAAVHTAAASALGRILLKITKKAGYPVIHIVRRPEQEKLLRKLGGEFVLNSSEEGFMDRLRETAGRLKATIAFDAVGGELTAGLVEALPRGSQIVVYGALSGQPAGIDTTRLIFDNKQVEGFWFSDWMEKRGPVRTFSCIRGALKGVGVDWTTDIADRVSLGEIHEAIGRYEGDMTRGKIIIRPNG